MDYYSNRDQENESLIVTTVEAPVPQRVGTDWSEVSEWVEVPCGSKSIIKKYWSIDNVREIIPLEGM